MKVFYVDGGLGRVLCSVPAFEEYYQRKQAIIFTPLPEIFQNNPIITNVYKADANNLWQKIVRNNEYSHLEPYQRPAYYRQKEHLIQSFSAIINGKPKMGKPNLYFSDDEKTWIAAFRHTMLSKTRKRKLIAFQPYGQTWDGAADPFGRSFPLNAVVKIVNKLNMVHWDAAILNCTQSPISNQNVLTQRFSTREFICAVAACDAVFTIDSSVSHIGAALNKPGVLVLGGSFRANLGYDNYTIFQKEGYPVAYDPIRLNCYWTPQNQQAMSLWSDHEIDQMVASLFNKKE